MNTNERRKYLKNKCIKYLGGSCIKCGYSKCESVLSFHHREPNKKSFPISDALSSSNGASGKWSELKTELDKCDLLCANCHLELHESFAAKRKLNKKIKNSKTIQTNKFIGWPSLDDLCKMIKKESFVKVGKKLGVSDNGIRKYLKRHNIDPKNIRNISMNGFYH